MAKTISQGGCLILLLLLGAVAWVVRPVLSALVELVLTSLQWENLLAVLAAVCLLCGAFVVTHLRPLNDNEVRELATKRRNNEIRVHFTFHQGQTAVDPQFKKRMVPTGTSYSLRCPLHGFPSLAAGVLKYKKHEWVLMAFERNKQVELVWENKGADNTQVSLLLDTDPISSAIERGYDSVLVFHNHPNPDPRHFDCLKPSEQDELSAERSARLFNSVGINYLEFVCERGRYREFSRSPADRFLPVPDFVAAINGANGLGKIKNLRLHLERVFGKLGIAPRLTLHPNARQRGQEIAPLTWNPYLPARPSIWSQVRRGLPWVLKGSLVCTGIVIAWYVLKFLLYALVALFFLSAIAKGRKR